MQTIIKWHKTSEEMPEQRFTLHGKNKFTGEPIVMAHDDACLIIYDGKIKHSRYLTEAERWEGCLPGQTPEYWVKFNELTFGE